MKTYTIPPPRYALQTIVFKQGIGEMHIINKCIYVKMLSQVSKSDSPDPLDLMHVPSTRNHCCLPLCKTQIWTADKITNVTIKTDAMKREKHKQCVSLFGVYYLVNSYNARGRLFSLRVLCLSEKAHTAILRANLTTLT